LARVRRATTNCSAAPSTRGVRSRSDLHDVTQKDLVIVEKGTLLFGWDGSDRRLVDQFAQIATDFGVVPRRVSMGDEPAMFEGVSPRYLTDS